MSTPYYELETVRLENQHIQLDVLANAGPRIARLMLPGRPENMLAELPNFVVSGFHFRGGHRLWHAPEVLPRTYAPDDEGLQIETLPGGLRLVAPVEESTGIQKAIEIRLNPDRAGVRLTHSLTNTGPWAVELAAWALTMLPPGGEAVLPLPVGNVDATGLLPNRRLALWPYSRFDDPRVVWRDAEDAIRIQAVPGPTPFKIGYFSTAGWLSYSRNGVLFRKRFVVQPEVGYPDFGCNAECYCGNEFIELESVGPLVKLQPGASTLHVEDWEIDVL